MLNAGCLVASCHVAPPLNDTTLMSPLEPPSFQRSCWKAPTRCIGLVGSAVMKGSTSAPGLLWLPSAVCWATSCWQTAELAASGLSGTRTTAPAANALANTVVVLPTVTIAPAARGASQRGADHLGLDLMATSSL